MNTSSHRRKRQRGQEILEFGLVLMFMMPVLLGTFVIGMNLVKYNSCNNMTRSLADMFIHGADFSTYFYQQVAQKEASGMNFQMPAFGSGVSYHATNTGTSGDGIITISQVMYVGTNSDPQCVAISPSTCSNASKFVFSRRIRFGNSSLVTAHASPLGDPSTSSIDSAGYILNPVTDSGAQLPTTGQSFMVGNWQTTANGRAPLIDGQICYIVEAYFQTPSLAIGSFGSAGVYSIYYF